MTKANAETKAADTAAKFMLTQLIGSKRFTLVEKSVLKTVLNPGETYTIAEANAAIEQFKKKEVL